MSRTYIGPFGRILPLPDESTSPDLHDQPAAQMLAHQPPLLPLPSRLEFGSDPRPGFTDPNRYETISRSRRPLLTGRPDSREKLPPVSQLLIPGTRPAAPSVFSPGLELGPPAESSSDPIPSYPADFSSRQYPQGDNSYFRLPYLPTPPTQPLYVDPSRNTIPNHPPPTTIPSTHHSGGEAGLPRPPVSPDETRQGWRQPHPPMLAGPPRWHQRQRSDQVSEPITELVAAQRSRDVDDSTKQVRRVVGEEVVPGEGPCYVYEDGSYVKKFIDGEVVNAQWGVTKAGKPRKRLAIACMTCREKKIKCDPGEPKCVQCDKSGRECRFQTAVRGQHAHPSSPSSEPQARTPTSSLSAQTENHFDELYAPRSEPPKLAQSPSSRHGTSTIHTTMMKRSLHRLPEASQPPMPTKKLRHRSREGSDTIPSEELVQGRPTALTYPAAERPCEIAPDPTPCLVDPLASEWRNDPYQTQPQLVLHYMTLYFSHINSATYRMFPQTPFLDWLQNAENKTPDELMVVYSILAMASIFSNRDSRKSDGALFARTARYAIEKNHGQFTLQLAQSRILIGLYYFAAGDATQAWDYGGAGVRVTTGLKMNLEQAIGQMEHDTPLDYGFNRQALEECYRRTFWCAFITDRFNGYATGLLCILQKEDIFLRLPCDDHRYEQQLQTEAPHFDNGIIDKRLVNPLAHATKGFMAYLITLATIWNDMLAEAYRLKHQASEDYAEAYERRYQKTYSRLESWQRELPPRYRLNVENTIVSVHDGNASMFSSMHCLYHTTGMILNRRVRHTCLPAASIDRNVRKALHHAQQLLSMIQTFHEMPHPEHSSTSHPHQELSGPVLISTPFNGYGIMNVIDITSATGSLDAASFRDTLECWNSALAVLKQVARFWDSAKRQKRTVKKRVQAIVSCVLARGQGKLAWIAGTPLETPFNALDLDLFYSHPSSSLLKTGPNRILAAALGMKADESQILFLEDEDLRRSSLDGGGMGAMHDLRFTVPT